jgi:prepilin-type N-terminal cleavage/methylation domain-containing protein
MLIKLNSCFPTRVLSNGKGFTVLELAITMVLLAVVLAILSAVLPSSSKSKQKNGAYIDKDGQRYYPLARLPDKGILAGVCAGIAYKWGISPWIPRFCFIVLTCAFGSGILAYVIIYIFTSGADTPRDYLERTGG